MAQNITTTGWHDPPNGRGTFDILKTCIGTVFLLCWSSVCPNVPSVKGGYWVKFAAKLNLFLLAMLGPDFIFMIALGQFNAAWRAKKAFREAGYKWSLRHCFFVNMGGVHLQFTDRNPADSFPVDCYQLLRLAKKKYIKLPEISKEDIDDRNKADGLVRLIAVVQSTWFTINSLGRVIQGLFLTTMELTTLAFVFLMTGCSICWWRKPMDVSRPVIVRTDVALSTILRNENAPTPLRGNTPLSFLNRQEWFMSTFWAYYYQILQDLRIFPRQNYNTADMDHFPSIDFPRTDTKWDTMGGSAIPIYSCIFMAAWNFDFPTEIEQRLWRVSSIMCLVYGTVGGLVAYLYHHGSSMYRYALNIVGMPVGGAEMETDLSYQTQPVIQQRSRSDRHRIDLTFALRRIRAWFNGTLNNSPEKDPALAIVRGWWILVSLFCLVYLFSRAYILVEDVLALRALPASAYQTPNWGPYSPIL